MGQAGDTQSAARVAPSDLKACWDSHSCPTIRAAIINAAWWGSKGPRAVHLLVASDADTHAQPYFARQVWAADHRDRMLNRHSSQRHKRATQAAPLRNGCPALYRVTRTAFHTVQAPHVPEHTQEPQLIMQGTHLSPVVLMTLPCTRRPSGKSALGSSTKLSARLLRRMRAVMLSERQTNTPAGLTLRT